MKKMILLAAVLGLVPSAAYPQGEDFLELLRADLKAEKTAILTQNLELTEAEAGVFWPIYREYDLKLSALQDERLVLIKDYAVAYDTMGPETALTLTEKAIDLSEQRMKLQKQYFKRFAKEVNPMAASRWVHVESMISNLVDLKIQSEIPMMPKVTEPKAAEPKSDQN